MARALRFRSRVEFTRSLALLVGARLNVVDALRSIASHSSDKSASTLARRLGHRVSRGVSLSNALRSDGFGFDLTYRQLIRVGEETGDLAGVLDRLVGHMERSLALRRKLRAVMAYPVMIVVVASAAIAFLLGFIVPSFAAMYRDFGAELPGATKRLLAASGFLKSNALLMLLVLVAAGWGLRHGLDSPRFRRLLAGLVIRLPVIGRVIREAELAQLVGTLATMLRGGVALTEALQIVARSSSNPLVREDTRRLALAVKRGRDLSAAAMGSRLIPPALAQLIAVGEQSGDLDNALTQAATHYSSEVEASVESLSSLIEPTVILALGLVLGAILIALYLPIFELSSVVG